MYNAREKHNLKIESLSNYACIPIKFTVNTKSVEWL